MKKLLKILLYLIVSTVFLGQSFAYQPQNYQGKLWLNLGGGLGAATQLNNPIFSAEISGNYMTTQHQLLTVRAIGNADMTSLGSIFIFPFCAGVGANPDDCAINGGHVNDFSALYGYINKNKTGYISASIGIGYTSTQKTTIGKNEAPRRVTVGIPLEIQSFWTPFKYFGIGIIGTANANANQPSVAGLLALQFGDLK